MAVAAAYVGARIVVYLAILGAMALRPGSTFIDHLTEWDSSWYLSIIESGYPADVPSGQQNPTAFFPLFPLMARAVAASTPLGPLDAGVIVALVAGLAATLLIARLGMVVTGTVQAQQGAILFALFPASYVFNVPYSEGVMVALVAGALLAAHHDRWILAGTLAALATASRPNAVAVVLALGVAAVLRLRVARRGEDALPWWRPVAAVAMAPLGLLAYFLYLGWRTGDALASIEAQQAWGQGFDFGVTTVSSLWTAVVDPIDNFNRVALVFAVVTAVAGVTILVRERLWVLLTFSAAVIGPTLVATSYGSRPRFVLAAFPVIAALGWKARPGVFAGLATLFAVLLVLATQLTLTGLWLVP